MPVRCWFWWEPGHGRGENARVLIDPLSTQAPAVIARYASTVHAAARAEHHVVSGLGAWLVLALASQASTADSDGGDADARHAVEAGLGLPLVEAGRVAVDLLGGLPPAVVAAVGLWWREEVATDRLTAYVGRLPTSATREPLTGQEQLDAWARERTFGLIDRFPIQVRPALMLLLASAVATKVRWWQPFDVVPATELAVPGRPGGFADAVTRALRSVSGHDVRLVRTQAAGLVGAHVAASRDGLAVVSVLGAPDVDRGGVLAAAHEVALGLNGTRIGQWVSLFDAPAGRSDLGEIVEQTVVATGPPEEGCAVLPTWHASTDINLLEGPTADSLGAAGQLLAGLLPPGPWMLEARQAAVASYTREGFEAAAVTGLAVDLSAPVPRQMLRRTLTLRFDRPYAAVAVAAEPSRPRDHAGVDHQSGEQTTTPLILPVFSAWVAEPAETPAAQEPSARASLQARLPARRQQAAPPQHPPEHA
jgi:hypothetical protein